ncbi:hypothetical protein B0H14DRAFT_2976401 [Mycena olivaceomarginata]|nr:hypothetical protein B0H14DRAFT_2976401 [Mycena olivaceomarginata]
MMCLVRLSVSDWFLYLYFISASFLLSLPLVFISLHCGGAFLFQCLRCSPSSFVKWFLAHGGSVDIADSDGMAVRYMATRQKSLIPGLAALIAASDRERKKAGDGGGICCALCGREADETMK